MSQDLVLTRNDPAQAKTAPRPRARSSAGTRDSLTDWPDRMLLSDRLAQEISRARRDRYRVAVLFVDPDRFGQLNEILGQVIADQVLHCVGIRLLSCARSSDIVGLQGADKFAILVPGIRYVQDAAVIAERTLRVLRVPYRLGQHELQVTASIGIVAYPDDGTDVETLFKNAGLALHNANERGCDCYHYFMEHMNLRAPEWQSLEGAVRLAREKQEFLLHDQPTLDLEIGISRKWPKARRFSLPAV